MNGTKTSDDGRFLFTFTQGEASSFQATVKRRKELEVSKFNSSFCFFFQPRIEEKLSGVSNCAELFSFAPFSLGLVWLDS